MYSGLKFEQLISRHNPTMSSYYKMNEYSNGQAINLRELNFKMAVTVENFNSPKKQKNDPRYVKWIFRMYGKREGKYF